jgi:hypothetical protein
LLSYEALVDNPVGATRAINSHLGTGLMPSVVESKLNEHHPVVWKQEEPDPELLHRAEVIYQDLVGHEKNLFL